MKMAYCDRLLVAGMLTISILIGLFACGLHHGQMSGFKLSGLDTAFCSTADKKDSRLDGSDSSQAHSMAQLTCPLCHSCSASAALSSFQLGLDYHPASAVAPIVVRSWAQPPPRYLRFSLNPRASPSIFLAVNSIA
ncbi:DUF2946 family protein [Pseudomonas sp. S9]|uniref:DUF2946 family protein n=1 Tax=Pseudomonas sp. S9 TaxID=686578 RepID=UPI0002556938|nr:DUF2946 family protein [Pseudomonas sp. S9]